MNDLIERQAAIDALREYITEPNVSDDESEIEGFNSGIETSIAEIGQNVPSAQPEQKIGHWVFKHGEIDWNLGAWRCSECGMYNFNLPCEFDCEPYEFASAHYCPCCGARMEKVYE